MPEETQLCVVTKLHILCLPLSRAPFPVDAHARTQAGRHTRWSWKDVKSFHAQRISSLEHRTEIHHLPHPPPPSPLISKKDADLPKEYMSPKKISIIQQGRRAPKPKPVVKPLIMLLILRKKKITTSSQPFFSSYPSTSLSILYCYLAGQRLI